MDDELLKGMGNHNPMAELVPKFMHVASMIVDDSIEAEFGVEI